MASFQKTPQGTWRAMVMVNYKRKTKTFTTKSEAQAWAMDAARDLASGKKNIPHKTFGQLLEKFCLQRATTTQCSTHMFKC